MEFNDTKITSRFPPVYLSPNYDTINTFDKQSNEGT